LTAAGFTGASGCGGGAFSAGPQEAGVESGGVESGGGEAAADTASGDAPLDTSVPEAGSDGDAGSAGDHWCVGRPELFCEDFDEETNVTPFLSTWTTSQATGGSFQFDTSNNVPSPPNALRATGASGAQVIVVKSFPHLASHPKTVRLAFELRINIAGTEGLLSAAGFVVVSYGTQLSDGYVAMAIGTGPSIVTAWAAPTDAGVGDAGPFQTAKANGTFPSLMMWAGRYTLEIDYAASTAGGGCIQAYQGPTPLLTTCMPLPPSLANPAVLSIAIGDYAGGLGNTGATDIEFDDVTFDVAY